MDHYMIWCSLAPGVDDMAFAGAVSAWLGHLAEGAMIDSHSLWRRKLGFGPDGLGDWVIDIRTTDMAQLDRAFQHAAARTGEAERLHSAVFTKIAQARFGLYRDFPDPVRPPR